MVLFENPRDNTQVVNLAKQMYPGSVKYMQEAFREATSVPHGYLFVYLKQSTSEHLRLKLTGTVSLQTRKVDRHRKFTDTVCLQNKTKHG